MAIKEEVTQSYFVKEFKELRQDNFSNRGLEALYLYLSELSEEIGEDIELDVIALSCEWVEYDSLEECLADYSETFQKENTTIEKLREHTQVIEIEDSKAIIIQQF